MRDDFPMLHYDFLMSQAENNKLGIYIRINNMKRAYLIQNNP